MLFSTYCTELSFCFVVLHLSVCFQYQNYSILRFHSVLTNTTNQGDGVKSALLVVFIWESVAEVGKRMGG